jgi:hypothetical protein
VEKSGEKSQYFTAFNSPHQQPPLQITKGDLELDKKINPSLLTPIQK